MPQISPTIAFYFTLAMAVLGAIATGAVSFPDSIPQDVQSEIKQWDMFVVAIWTVVAPILHGLSSNATGPLVSEKALAK